MVIAMHDYGEFLNVAERLTALGIRWRSGHKLAELYQEFELFPPYRRILKIMVLKELDNTLDVICVDDYADVYTDYEDFMRLPVNYALTINNKIIF